MVNILPPLPLTIVTKLTSAQMNSYNDEQKRKEREEALRKKRKDEAKK